MSMPSRGVVRVSDGQRLRHPVLRVVRAERVPMGGEVQADGGVQRVRRVPRMNAAQLHAPDAVAASWTTTVVVRGGMACWVGLVLGGLGSG